MRTHLSVGYDFIDIEELKQQHSHLQPSALKGQSYVNVGLILGQDVFHVIRPLQFFETYQKETPFVVGFPLCWISNGPLPFTSNLFALCFQAVTQAHILNLVRHKIVWCL